MPRMERLGRTDTKVQWTFHAKRSTVVVTTYFAVETRPRSYSILLDLLGAFSFADPLRDSLTRITEAF